MFNNSLYWAALLLTSGAYFALPYHNNNLRSNSAISARIYSTVFEYIVDVVKKYYFPLFLTLIILCWLIFPKIYLYFTLPIAIICGLKIRRYRMTRHYIQHCNQYVEILQELANLLRSGQDLTSAIQILATQSPFSQNSSHPASESLTTQRDKKGGTFISLTHKNSVQKTSQKSIIVQRLVQISHCLYFDQSITITLPDDLFSSGTKREQKIWQLHIKILQLSLLHGLPLVDIIESFIRQLRFELYSHRKIESSVAGARLSATILNALPIVGIAFGQMLGAHPLHILLHTYGGTLILIIGCIFLCIGMWWADAIIARAISL